MLVSANYGNIGQNTANAKVRQNPEFGRGLKPQDLKYFEEFGAENLKTRRKLPSKELTRKFGLDENASAYLLTSKRSAAFRAKLAKELGLPRTSNQDSINKALIHKCSQQLCKKFGFQKGTSINEMYHSLSGKERNEFLNEMLTGLRKNRQSVFESVNGTRGNKFNMEA